MKLKVFAIFDDKAKAFIPPFTLPERGMALRAFADSVNNPEHQFGRHPHDYTLFQLGEVDTASGTLIPAPSGIEVLANGVAVKRTEKDERQPALLPDLKELEGRN